MAGMAGTLKDRLYILGEINLGAAWSRGLRLPVLPGKGGEDEHTGK
jgi:hypothetical protein